jgi:hypothetical protein
MNKGSNYRNGKKEGASGIRNSMFQNISPSSYSTGVIQNIFIAYFAYKTIRNHMFSLPSMGMCVCVYVCVFACPRITNTTSVQRDQCS